MLSLYPFFIYFDEEEVHALEKLEAVGKAKEEAMKERKTTKAVKEGKERGEKGEVRIGIEYGGPPGRDGGADVIGLVGFLALVLLPAWVLYLMFYVRA